MDKINVEVTPYNVLSTYVLENGTFDLLEQLDISGKLDCISVFPVDDEEYTPYKGVYDFMGFKSKTELIGDPDYSIIVGIKDSDVCIKLLDDNQVRLIAPTEDIELEDVLFSKKK